MNKSILVTFGLTAPFLAGPVFGEPGFNVYKHTAGGSQITDYATADALIGGSNLEFSNTSNFNTSNTQDNGDAGGPFGLGVQLPGLAAGDNDDFAFQAEAAFTVSTTGNYVFSTNTDDGSRLRLSVNGAPFNQIIADDVLSGPHTVNSTPVALLAGNTVDLQWMWFERGGGAEGESFYSRDGGALALWQTAAEGLTLTGGAYSGTVYKSTSGQPNPNNLAAADNLVTNGTLAGSGVLPTINFGGGGRIGGENAIPGGGGDNFTLSANGYITLAGGDYTFFTNTDDGARLRIDGADVVVDDFLQGPTDSAYVSINLDGGTHFLEYTGFELGGGESFELWMAEGNFAAAKGAGAFPGAADWHLVGDATFPVDTVPEPGVSLLAGIGGLAALRRRRR